MNKEFVVSSSPSPSDVVSKPLTLTLENTLSLSALIS